MQETLDHPVAAAGAKDAAAATPRRMTRLATRAARAGVQSFRPSYRESPVSDSVAEETSTTPRKRKPKPRAAPAPKQKHSRHAPPHAEPAVPTREPEPAPQVAEVDPFYLHLIEEHNRTVRHCLGRPPWPAPRAECALQNDDAESRSRNDLPDSELRENLLESYSFTHAGHSAPTRFEDWSRGAPTLPPSPKEEMHRLLRPWEILEPHLHDRKEPHHSYGPLLDTDTPPTLPSSLPLPSPSMTAYVDWSRGSRGSDTETEYYYQADSTPSSPATLVHSSPPPRSRAVRNCWHCTVLGSDLCKKHA